MGIIRIKNLRINEFQHGNKRISINNNEKVDLNNLPQKVQITFKDNTIKDYTIIDKTTNYLISSNNNVIHIKDIKEIKKA